MINQCLEFNNEILQANLKGMTPNEFGVMPILIY